MIDFDPNIEDVLMLDRLQSVLFRCFDASSVEAAMMSIKQAKINAHNIATTVE